MKTLHYIGTDCLAFSVIIPAQIHSVFSFFPLIIQESAWDLLHRKILAWRHRMQQNTSERETLENKMPVERICRTLKKICIITPFFPLLPPAEGSPRTIPPLWAHCFNFQKFCSKMHKWITLKRNLTTAACNKLHTAHHPRMWRKFWWKLLCKYWLFCTLII